MKYLLRQAMAHIKHGLRVTWYKIVYYAGLPFRPIYIEEGAVTKKWYGYCRYVPTLSDVRYNESTWRWEKIAYPVPFNLVVSLWYWMVYMIWRGCRLPPQYYRNHYFQVFHRCPHCKEDLIERHFWPKEVLAAVEEEEEEERQVEDDMEHESFD